VCPSHQPMLNISLALVEGMKRIPKTNDVSTHFLFGVLRGLDDVAG
jgi:hypothetical protein